MFFAAHAMSGEFMTLICVLLGAILFHTIKNGNKKV